MSKCIICGEQTKEGDVAEMYDRLAIEMNPDIDNDDDALRMKLAGVVHPDCGIALGWEQA